MRCANTMCCFFSHFFGCHASDIGYAEIEDKFAESENLPLFCKRLQMFPLPALRLGKAVGKVLCLAGILQ